METYEQEQDETYRKIIRAKISLSKDFPFFYDLMFFMKFSENNVACPTMSVDLYGNVLYNKQYVNSLSHDELRAVLTHEVLHKSFLHVSRGVSYLNLNNGKAHSATWRKWNKAVDVVVNNVLTQNGFTLPKGTACMPTGNFDEIKILSAEDTIFHLVKEVSKKSAEVIYREIPDEKCPICQLPFPSGLGDKSEKKEKSDEKSDDLADKGGVKDENKPKEKGLLDGIGDGEKAKGDGDNGNTKGDGDGDNTKGNGDGSCDGHGTCKGHMGKGKIGKGRMKDGEGEDNHDYGDGRISEQEIKRLDDEWKQRVINASCRAKSIGKSPAGLERWIDGLLESKIDWRTKLYKFITDGIPSDFTYSRKNKKSDIYGYYMPSYLKEQLKVAVFIDTSGSIGDDELMRFKSECVGIAKSFESIDMIIGYCDTEVKGKPLEVANGNVAKIMEYKALGGGGTDMTKCFTWINKNAPENELIVIFTDGYTPFPTKKLVGNRNVLWVISSGGLDAEKVVKQWNGEAIGEVIKIDEVD